MKKIFRVIFNSDLLRIFSLISPSNRIKATALFLLMSLQSFFELLFILTLTYMGMALTAPSLLEQTFFVSCIFYFFPEVKPFFSKPTYFLLLIGIEVVLVSFTKNAVAYLTARMTTLLGERISIDICHEIMSRFLYKDYAWHLSSESKETFQCMQWRSDVANMLNFQLGLYTCTLTMIVLFFLLMGKEPMLTSMVLLLTVFIGIILYASIRKSVDRSAHTIRQASAEENRAVLCAIRGIRDVLIYRQQETFLEAITKSATRAVPSRVFNSIAPTMPTWVLETTAFIAVVLALAYIIFVEHAGIPRIAEALSLLVLTAWRVLPFANRAVSFKVAIRSARPMAMAVIDLLEKLRLQPVNMRTAPARDFTFERSITFSSVSFRYPASYNDSLHDLNFTINVGEKIGIIGASGAGKSTLVAILSGVMLPTGGSILVDNLPLTPSRAAAFSSLVGYVPQQAFLFEGTLGDNIAFCHWGKPWKQEDVLTACRSAAIDFVKTNPNGLNQIIGENGAGLSGGQAQRVSIARAMYPHPKLLIFDEATSSLDLGNENSIMATIDKLATEVTCVIVAHRLSTVERCDRLLWLDHGQLVMQGPPREVLPLYCKRLDIAAK